MWYDLDNLHESFKKVYKASGWKTKTQLYKERLLPNLCALKQAIENGTYEPKPPNIFIQNERGKTRCIESYNINDRLVQLTFVREVILPKVLPKIIYDNSATLKNRGVSHFRNRLFLHLKQHIAKYGPNGYILLTDFSKYFDNISHAKAIELFRKWGVAEEDIDFLKKLLKVQEIDISYLPDEYAERAESVKFDSVAYYTSKELRPFITKRTMKKSVGIGSNLAQTIGISYATKIDNYCKIVQGIRGYGRYADDIYAIHISKEKLQEVFEHMQQIADELGLFINIKKTKIVPITETFEILKQRYKVLNNGYILVRPLHEVYSRVKRKLVKLDKLKKQGKITQKKINEMYGSTIGNLRKFGETIALKNVEDKYTLLFDNSE